MRKCARPATKRSFRTRCIAKKFYHRDYLRGILPLLGIDTVVASRGGDFMNRFVLGAIALATIAAGAPATAADLAVKPVPATPPLTWTGAHVGASVGGIWGNDKITDLDGLNSSPNPPVIMYTLKDAGVIGSGVIGYNFQY